MTARILALIAALVVAGCQGYDTEPPCVPEAIRVCTCSGGLGLAPGERANGTTCGLGCSGQGDCPPTGVQVCDSGQRAGYWSPCDCVGIEPRATQCPEGTVRADVHRCVPRIPSERCL